MLCSPSGSDVLSVIPAEFAEIAHDRQFQRSAGRLGNRLLRVFWTCNA